MSSFKTPTQPQIDACVQRMRSPEFAAYFLSRLQNPRWIKPLCEHDLFANPPPAVPVEDGRVVFPHWPASEYLARMASNAPSEVAAVLADLDTKNSSVIGNMLDAASAMPPDIAATLVPAVARAAKAGALWIHFGNAAALCAQLADGGEVESAITLADALFTPKGEDGQPPPGRRDTYWYKEGLGKVVPAIAPRRPGVFLPKLCEWLSASIEATTEVDPETGSDGSCTWRPAIEEHGQNRDNNSKGVIVGFVRQGFELAIRDRQLLLEDALRIIEHKEYLVFKRIRLHLINEFAQGDPELARRSMMDRELFDDYRMKHEYAMLAGNRLSLLTPEERATWFGWIDAGPDMSEFEDTDTDGTDARGVEERRKARTRYWQFEKLHWVREHLEGEHRSFYESMLKEHGHPDLADLNVYCGPVQWGYKSPMSVEDLAKLSFEEAVETVSAWRPEAQGYAGPDIEALGETFQQYVSTQLEAFSVKAPALLERPAIYVRGFINQMREAVKSEREIDISAVLELCAWVLERPVRERTTPGPNAMGLVDKDWQWTRDDIGKFAESVCKARTESSPRYPLEGLREPIWQLIVELCQDSSESNIVHDFSRDDPRGRDYLNLAINSSRGQAVEAGLEYARWVGQHLKQSDGERETVPGGFGVMPEVRKMLEWQIAAANRSLVAMSIIGSRIRLIHWIDKDWLTSNAERLFHLQGIEETPPDAEGWAAWNAFLIWVGPYVELYTIFKPQFTYAVEQAALADLSDDGREQPMHHLGQHMMILYGRGEFDLDDGGGLLGRFLDTANPEIRRHSIRFVGQILANDNQIPEEVVDRFKRLWEVYWAGTGKVDAAEKPDGWLFGTWFSSGRFPAEWALEHLEQFVDVVPIPEPDKPVAEQLAKIAPTNISQAVRILDRMVRGDREGWHIHTWLPEAKQVLTLAMSAGSDPQVKARQILDYLGRRGYTNIGELLDRGRSTDTI